MKKIVVNGKEYKIKFGYLAVASSDILKDVLKLQSKIEVMANKKKDVGEDESISVIDDVIPLVGRVTLAGLQSKHADEFGVDYEDEADVRQKLLSVFRLLDEYFDPDDGKASESAIEMFWDYVNELGNAGFLSGKTEAQTAEQQTLPIELQDHKKAQK